MSSSVGLVIPALDPDVDRLREYVSALTEAVEPATIRIELDDPSDRYAGLDERLDAEVATVRQRRGKGLAITAGFAALETDIKAFVDADGATDPVSVAGLVDAVRSDQADLAIGSRHRPGATVEGRSRTRRTMSRVFAGVAGIATGVTVADFQCGAKAITAECWGDIVGDLTVAGFGWDLEVLWLAATNGWRIEEVPVRWDERPGSTVPPLETAVSLTTLAGRISLARLRRQSSLRPPAAGRLLDRCRREGWA